MIALGPIYGINTACDTLMSQYFGAKNKKKVGTVLQKGKNDFLEYQTNVIWAK
jgi:Na+-driven multidrug efflux pump